MVLTCNFCHQPFKTYEHYRRFCSEDCHKAYRKSQPPKYQVVTVTCHTCGAAFERRKIRCRNQRNFCSQSCKMRYVTNQQKAPKTMQTYTCEHCNNTFEVKAGLSHIRRFCSRECFRGWQSKNSVIHTTYSRKRALETHKPACMICGFDIVVEVHHIMARGEGGTNDIENLVVLCPNHHVMANRGLIPQKKLFNIVKKFLANQPHQLEFDTAVKKAA